MAIILHVEDGIAAATPDRPDTKDALDHAMRLELPLVFRSDDFREGVAAFKDKRQARFTAQ